MNLEQRVQALENEVAVLKNQIQTTLLDIQAMLMTNAHPALRGEAQAPSSNWNDDTPPAVSPASALPVRKFSLEQTGDTDDDDALPLVRQASPVQTIAANPPPAALTPGRNGAKEPAQRVAPTYAEPLAPAPRPAQASQFLVPEAPQRSRQAAAPSVQQAQDDRMEQLRLWVQDKVDELGGQIAIDELLTYSHSDYFTPEELNELINFAMEAAEAQLAQSRPPVPPALPPARRGRKAAANKPEITLKGRKVSIRPQHEFDDEHEEQRRTLLRLIAGIQNAGTHKWGKK